MHRDGPCASLHSGHIMSSTLPPASLSPFSHSVGELVKGEARTIETTQSVRNAARQMMEEAIGSLLVVKDGIPAGILTKSDLVGRVLVPELPPQTPVGDILTQSVVTIERDRPIFDGLLLMIQHNIGHLAVTEQGRLVGVVSEHDWLTFQERHPAALFRLFDKAASVEELAALRSKANRQVRYLFGAEGTADALTRFVTQINDRTGKRVIQLALESFSREAGAPPVRFAWIAMGSEGRSEQTLSTDQDNGIVFENVPEKDVDKTRKWFLEFAARVVDGLEVCGFPRCKGNVMASTPELCLPLEGWQRKFAGYLAVADEEALLRASIYFDFRCLWGESSLVSELWADLLANMENNKGFLRFLCGSMLEGRPPVNTLGWRVRNLFGLPKPPLDLKKQALAPLVAAARVMALAAGSSRTHTLERLEDAARAELLPNDLARAAREAYEFLMLQRIRQHFRQQDVMEPPSNTLEVKSLNPLQQAFLADSLQTVIDLQDHVAYRFGGTP